MSTVIDLTLSYGASELCLGSAVYCCPCGKVTRNETIYKIVEYSGNPLFVLLRNLK